MRILGIIAEYDPFHRGHERHLRLARERVRPDFTYIALSGCFKQRGEPALLSPFDRAACALEAGADAVFFLPTVWTVRDAEHYALGGVSLLQALGATHLAFGAEDGRTEPLEALAELLESPDGVLRGRLREHLTSGRGYPSALAAAVGEIRPELAPLLEKPNNTLAVCYLRAIRRLQAGLEPVPIPRHGGYHADRIDPEEPSASALREALGRGSLAPVRAAVTEKSGEVLQRAMLEGRLPREERLDTLLISRLRGMTPEEMRRLPDLSEGLEDRLREAARRVNTREELLNAVSTRRYPRARISRICAAALLGLTADGLAAEPLPRKAVLLGLRKNPEMTALWREKGRIGPDWTEEADLRAWRIWSLCAGLPDTLPWTERTVTAKNPAKPL